MRYRPKTNVMGLGVMLIALNIAMGVCWVVNLVQLVGVDWNHINENPSPAIIHGIGLFPYASIVTVWFPNT